MDKTTGNNKTITMTCFLFTLKNIGGAFKNAFSLHTKESKSKLRYKRKNVFPAKKNSGVCNKKKHGKIEWLQQHILVCYSKQIKWNEGNYFSIVGYKVGFQRAEFFCISADARKTFSRRIIRLRCRYRYSTLSLVFIQRQFDVLLLCYFLIIKIANTPTLLWCTRSVAIYSVIKIYKFYIYDQCHHHISSNNSKKKKISKKKTCWVS